MDYLAQGVARRMFNLALKSRCISAVTVDRVTESFVHDPWSPYSSIANDVLLDFEDGALVRRWQHGPEVDEPLAYERYAGTTAGGTGTALELFRNRLGSVILAVSVSTGAVAAEYDYDSFGQRTQVAGTEEVRYGFTSREHDARTGLIHYRARAYDPLTGQFLQRDPIGFASGDLNLYAYVENDPYNWTDPSGEISGQYGNLARQSAQMARSAVGNIGRGVVGLANSIRNALVAAGPTIVAADRVASCASAVANASTGNAGAAAADTAGCVAGSAGGRAAGEALQEARAAHNAFRDSIAERLMRRGFAVATEVTFRGAGGQATRLDLVYRTPFGVIRAIEIKTRAGRLTRNQRDLFPEIRAGGTARPVGSNAERFFGDRVGIPSGPIQVRTIRFGGG